jgi:hypothetical protein
MANWVRITEKNSKGRKLINSSERTVESRKRQLSGTVRQKSQRLGYKKWWDRLSLKKLTNRGLYDKVTPRKLAYGQLGL